MSLIIISVTFVFERTFSINKAKGHGDISVFVKNVLEKLTKGEFDDALKECDKQRGSLANILRAGIERFVQVENDANFPVEKKLTEVQRAIDEATNLETPLLEKNLVILSTIASVSVLFGLLGTTIGMIRAFAAFGETGTVDATQLAIGISEALYNTAGGLGAAIISIIFFNYFTTKVDNYLYMIDDVILNVTQIFTLRLKQ
jgi:biopolymer transport protein ExbB